MELKDIQGLGKKKMSYLEKLGIYTMEDLIHYFPREYENRMELKDLRADGKALLHLEILTGPQYYYPRKGLNLVKFQASDGVLKTDLVFFNQPYVRNIFRKGRSYYFFGEIEKNNYGIQLTNPLWDVTLGDKLGRIVPVYPLTKGLTQKDMRDFIRQALSYYRHNIRDILPEKMRAAQNFLKRSEMIEIIHRPKDIDSLKNAYRTLRFEELLTFELAIKSFRNPVAKEGIAFKRDDRVDRFIDNLPFTLTNAQRKVFEEIREDMENNRPMNRMIQGDVGSGKTVVAVLAILKAYYNGYQSAFMAPTEILATQHEVSLKKFFEKTDLKMCLLKGSMTEKQKRGMKEKIKNGEIDLVIGTHALIEEDVEFQNPGLFIIDEQHRFGVRQRARFSGKGNDPDTLIMTATPIPRTLLLTLYDDLDVSVIDELPPGRKYIETTGVSKKEENKVLAFIKNQVRSGRQVYIVCPLIEESEHLDAESVEELFKRTEPLLRPCRCEMLHGKMKADEKEEIMKRFADGSVDVLYATTVIEVGVNVPNANTIVIYNAERFGLSQLHQLRGRVGRSSRQSYCILVTDHLTEDGYRRIRIMEETNDGFLIAKEDLRLRGGGDIMGTRQSGRERIDLASYSPKMIRDILKLSDYIIENNVLESKEFLPMKSYVEKIKDKLNNEIILN